MMGEFIKFKNWISQELKKRWTRYTVCIRDNTASIIELFMDDPVDEVVKYSKIQYGQELRITTPTLKHSDICDIKKNSMLYPVLKLRYGKKIIDLLFKATSKYGNKGMKGKLVYRNEKGIIKIEKKYISVTRCIEQMIKLTLEGASIEKDV